MASRKRRSADDGFDGEDERHGRGGRERDADERGADDMPFDDDLAADDVNDVNDVDDVDADDRADDGLDDDDDGTDRRRRSRSASPVAVARTRAAARAKAGSERGSPFARVLRFVREVVAELQKVIWPTRKELLTYTAVVVVFVAAMMLFVALLDLGFAKGMFLVFGSGADS